MAESKEEVSLAKCLSIVAEAYCGIVTGEGDLLSSHARFEAYVGRAGEIANSMDDDNKARFRRVQVGTPKRQVLDLFNDIKFVIGHGVRIDRMSTEAIVGVLSKEGLPCLANHAIALADEVDGVCQRMFSPLDGILRKLTPSDQLLLNAMLECRDGSTLVELFEACPAAWRNGVDGTQPSPEGFYSRLNRLQQELPSNILTFSISKAKGGSFSWKVKKSSSCKLHLI